MSSKSVRQGIVDAEFNSGAFGVLAIEITIVAVALGFYFKSWWVGGGVWLGAIMLSAVSKWFGIFLALVLSIVWGLIGFAIGTMFENTGAEVVCAALGFLIGLGTHLGAMQYGQDLGSSES